MKNIFVLLVLVFSTLFGYSQWEWSNPSPFGWSFNSVYFIDPQHGFVCGSTGKLFQTTDAGETWQETPTGLDEHLKKVYFLDLNIGFLITSNGNLLKTSNGGTSWLLIDLGVDINDIQFVTAQRGFVCGQGGALLMTTDAGLTWTQATLDPMFANWDINALYFVDEFSGYAVGDAGIKHKTIDGGFTWTTSWVDPMMNLYDVYFINAATGYASGEDRLILYTQTGGIQWESFMSSHTVTQMYFIDENTGFALSDGALVKTTDNGHHWVELALQGCNSYCFAGAQTVHGVGSYGVLLKSTDSGITYSSYTTNLTSDELMGIHFCNQDVGFAVGFSPQTLSDAHVFKTIDAGGHWEQVSTISLFYPTNVFFTSPLVGYISFCTGELAKTSDGGLTWEQLSTNTTACISGLTFTNPTTGYLIMEESPYSILKTMDAGASWQTIYQSSSFDALRGIHFLNENVGFVVTSGSCLRTLDAGMSWTEHPISDTSIFMDVFFANEQVGYIAGFSGEVYKTTDGGETWSYMPLPDYSTISKLFFIDENTGYALGNSGDFYQTSNGGITWIKLTYMPGQWFNGISFTTDLNGFICGGHGLIMKTTNGGAVSVDTKEKKSGTTIVWPNPAIDEIHLRGQFNLQPIKLDIFNSVGLLVKELELGSGSEKLNISDLGAGFYVVRIRSAQGEQETVRFVKY